MPCSIWRVSLTRTTSPPKRVGRKRLKKVPTSSGLDQRPQRKTGPPLVEDQLPALGRKKESKSVQGKSQQQHGPGRILDDRDDLPRPGDGKDQVEQQAEAENEFQQKKRAFCSSWMVPGMKFFIGFQQVGKIQGGVFFGGGQVGVPQQLLDDPQVRPPLQQVGGERMAQQVGMDVPVASALSWR